MAGIRGRTKSAAPRQGRDLNRFLFKALSEASDAIVAADSRERVTFWNKGAECLYGVKADKALGRPLSEVCPCRWPTAHPKRAAYGSLARAGHWRGESVYLNKSAKEINVDTGLTMVGGPRGAPRGFLAVSRDITPQKRAKAQLRQQRSALAKRIEEGAAELQRATATLQAELAERRRAEEALRQSESILRSFYESSPFMMGIVELLEDDILHISDNTATAKFFGRTPEAMRNRRASEMGVPQEHIHNWIGHYRQSERTGQPVRFEYPHHWATETRWLSATVCTIAGAQGARRRFSYVVEDITDRKRDEETLRHSQETLAEAQRIARLGSWDWDIVSNKLAWSDEIYRIFGLTPQAFGATYEAFLSSVHPDDREFVMKAVNDALYHHLPYSIDHRIVLPDGTERTVHEQAAVYLDDHGKPARMVGTVQDITESKLAEKELRRLNRALTAISQCNQAIIRAKEELELLRDVCEVIVTVGGYRMAWVGLAEQDEAKSVGPVTHAGFEDGYLKLVNITWADSERGRGPTGTAIRTGKPCVIRYTSADASFAPWRAEATKRGYASVIGLPLFKGEEAFGALTIYSAETDAFDTREVELLTELAGDLAYGVLSLRARAERALAEEARARLTAILEATTDFVGTADPEGRALYLNRGARKLLGIGEEEDISHIRIPDTHPEWANVIVLHEGIPTAIRDGVWSGETAILSRDGREIPVSQVILARKSPRGEVEYLSTIMRDITERKRADTALHRLSGRLLQLQDEERRHMARELHDTVGQNLAALAMNLALLEDSAEPLPPRAHEALGESQALAAQCSDEVRTLSYLLHPPLLDDMGLPSALRWYVDGFTKRSGIQVDLAASPRLGRLPNELETALFRIVQESLTNIHRHSESSRAEIQVVQDAAEITLEVRDEGRGMSPEASSGAVESVAGLGVGIRGMRERMRQLGGRLEIDSNTQGTTIRAILPLPGNNR